MSSSLPSSDELSPTARLLFRPIESVATGGCHAEVYLPEGTSEIAKGAERRGLPVVILIHGGAFIAGGCSQISLCQVEYLLANGIVCVSIEYRLGPHVDLTVQTSDCLAAVEWVRDGEMQRALTEEGKLAEGGLGIDGSRIAGLGYSAGGYLVTMLGHQASPPLAAVFSFYGVLDLETLATVPKEASLLGLTEQERVFALKIWDAGVITDDEEARRTNPVNPRSAWMQAVMFSDTFVSHVLPAHLSPTLETRRLLSPYHLLSLTASQPYPPTFLAIPELDALIPPSQSWRFAQRLKEIGVEVTCKRANGADHAFDQTGGSRNERGGDWFEEVVRPGLDFLVEKLRAV